MRRAKTQQMVIYEGGNKQGNSSSRKSKGSGGPIIIMNNAAQDISALNGSAGWDGVREGGLLIDTLVGASGVVIVDILFQNTPQVSKIEDQDQMQALLPGRKIQRSAQALAFGARTGVGITWKPSDSKTSSKVWQKEPSLSWIKKRKGCLARKAPKPTAGPAESPRSDGDGW